MAAPSWPTQPLSRLGDFIVTRDFEGNPSIVRADAIDLVTIDDSPDLRTRSTLYLQGGAVLASNHGVEAWLDILTRDDEEVPLD